MTADQGFLTGRVAVVTGGARGIGAATAAALSGHGATVVIGDVDLDAAERTAAGLPGDAYAMRLDVTDRAGFTAMLDDVEARLGPVDVLVNNAGIMALARIEDEPDDLTLRMLEINLHGVIHGSREAARRMRPRGRGAIVNVASSAGKLGVVAAATYCATKHGVVGFTESLRLELRGSGVAVVCVMPGIVRTELAAGMPDARGVPTVQPRDVASAIVDALRNGRFEVYVPRQVGRLVRFGNAMPRRLREAIARAVGAETIMLPAIGNAERDAYTRRAAASAPALDRIDNADR